MKRELRIQKVKGQNAFRIVKQTHRGMEFGKDRCSFKAKNGIFIESFSFPELWIKDKTFYVRGSTADMDDNVLKFDTPEQYRTIKQAVKEYNEWGRNNEI